MRSQQNMEQPEKLDLAAARERLLELRRQLQSLAATGEKSSQIVELDQTRVGRLSRMDALQAQSMAKESGRRRDEMLRNIAAALGRLDSGDYGYCQSCDEPISRRRLAFDPAARLCIGCAERAEKSG